MKNVVMMSVVSPRSFIPNVENHRQVFVLLVPCSRMPFIKNMSQIIDINHGTYK
jgi:hypothetical protein